MSSAGSTRPPCWQVGEDSQSAERFWLGQRILLHGLRQFDRVAFMETTYDTDPWYDEDYELDAPCPACGNPLDYCSGHGLIGDPAGFEILVAHEDGNHYGCHPDGCDGGIV